MGRPPGKSSRRNTERCPVSQKVRYRDHEEAVWVLHSAQTARALHGGATRRQERRAYHCQGCQGWHLTSQVSFDDPVVAGRGVVVLDLLSLAGVLDCLDGEGSGGGAGRVDVFGGFGGPGGSVVGDEARSA